MKHNNKPVYYLLVLIFLLVPAYVFPSGGIQLVDAPILLTMVYVLATHYKEEIRDHSFIVLSFFAFAGWALFVNMTSYLSDYSQLYVKASFHIIYVVLLFLSFVIVFSRVLRKPDSARYLYTALLLAAIIPLFVKGQPETGLTARHALSFNNPNQLASHGLAISAMVFVLNNFYARAYPEVKRSIYVALTSIAVFILAHYYVLLSASTAGLVGLIIIDVVLVITIGKKDRVPALMLVAFVVASSLFFYSVDFNETRIMKRIKGKDTQTRLENRTKDRFELDNLSLVFGSGKTSGRTGKKEVHNTFIDIVYSYGLIGGCLFGFFLLHYFKVCMYVKYHAILLLVFMPMHITHNLLRFRIVWIFYALLYAVSVIHYHASAKRAHQTGPPPEDRYSQADRVKRYRSPGSIVPSLFASEERPGYRLETR